MQYKLHGKAFKNLVVKEAGIGLHWMYFDSPSDRILHDRSLFFGLVE